ncbi:hypothetical protein I79_008189 [Cricetulus griseus]|uniref:Uncharacterized protein n=1 Tax=Cricetulus griseus TaxID=10029 RepID=G3HCH8_CRIGR|nr:hypothetical protein I79_008189 [Cricetulus griseus]
MAAHKINYVSQSPLQQKATWSTLSNGMRMHPQIPVPVIQGAGWSSYSIPVLVELSLFSRRWWVRAPARDSAYKPSAIINPLHCPSTTSSPETVRATVDEGHVAAGGTLEEPMAP